MSELWVRVDRIRYDDAEFDKRFVERWTRSMEALQAALIANAPPPITITLWRAAPPENRRLPMPLKYS